MADLWGNNTILSTGAAGQVKGYLSVAVNQAIKALNNATDNLKAINPIVSASVTAPVVDFIDTEDVNLPKEHVCSELDDVTLPVVPPTYKDPSDVNINAAELGTEYDGSPVYLPIPNNLTNIPDPDLPQKPRDAPLSEDIIFPLAPILAEVPNPNVYPINIPKTPITNVSDFDSIPPTYNGVPVPENDFSWSEDPYTSDILAQTQSVITEMLSGTTGIPDVIWDALWQRDADKEDKQAVRLIQEIREAFADSGFTLPIGIRKAKEQEVYVKIYESNNTRARDIAIKQAEHETENLKNAVIQGLAMENMLSQLRDRTLARLLDAAKYTVQSAIDIYNASVAKYNIDMQSFSLEMEAHRLELETEISRVEVYKSEVIAMGEVGKLNSIAVDTYVAMQTALKLKVDIYNIEVEAAKSKTEANKIIMEGYATEIGAYKTMVEAAMLDYEKYNIISTATGVQAQVLNANSDLFAKRVASVKSSTDQNINIHDAAIKEEMLTLDSIQKALDKYTTDSKVYVDKVEAKTKIASVTVQNKVAEYNRMGTVESNKLQEYSHKIDINKQEVLNEVSNARMELETAMFLAKNETNIAITSAGVQSDIGTAAMNAVNVHAGMTDGASTTLGYDGGKL